MNKTIVSLISFLLILSISKAIDCPEYYGLRNPGDTVCSPCTPNCKICEFGKCKQCDPNYGKVSAASFCNPCGEGKYSDSQSECQPCYDNGCIKCSGPGLKKCISCSSTYYLDEESKTCRQCGFGQYSPSNSTSPSQCQWCAESDCVKCSSPFYQKCSECRPGTTLSSGTCLSYYFNSNCARRVKSTKPNEFICQACDIGYHFNGGYSSQGCFRCKVPNCAVCGSSGDEACSSCMPGFYRISNDACGKCEDNACSFCSGAGPNQCKACKQGFTLIDSACVPCGIANCITCDTSSQQCSACKIGYYLDVQNNQCKYCGDGSASPIGARSFAQCGACQSREDKTCWTPKSMNVSASCQPGYGLTISDTYNSNYTTCRPCPLNCQSCDTTDAKITNCSTCNSGFYLNESKQCSLCQDNNCDQCSDAGIGKCLSCKSGFLLESGQCNAVCSDSKCVTCSGSGPNQCIKCLAGYMLNNNGQCESCGDLGCDTCSSPGQCLNCNAGFYANSTGACLKCPDGKSSPAGSTSITECYNCSDANCTSCTGRSSGSCAACITGYGLNSDNKCQKCSDSQCKSCVRRSNNQEECTVCLIGFSLNGVRCDACADSNCIDCFGVGTGKCSTCKNSYFKTQGNTCQLCDVGCTSCSGPQNCSACKSGYFKTQDNVCRPCQKGCAKCSEEGKCDSCASEYYLKDSQCVACPEGTASLPNSTRADACFTCQGAGCTSCTAAQGYEVCRACNDPYYLSVYGRCDRCPNYCKSCSRAGYGQCTLCERGYQVSAGQCIPCPQGTFINAAGNCQNCEISGCQTCEGPNRCTSCLPGFYMKGDKCIACEDGKYASSTSSGGTSPSYCRDCDTPFCGKCSGPGIYPGTCSSCKSGYYLLAGTGLCAPCQDIGCDSCSWAGTRQCTSCKADYYLEDNECTPCMTGMSSAPGSEQCKIANSTIVAVGGIGLLLAVLVVYLRKRPNNPKSPQRISMTTFSVRDPMLST